ncbi:MAG: prepilin-type N-terminal cleavage/methylation domain-containing protein [Acidobacteria bacterium]|nr:prepilin-type N-terminal cleavage/methylation domain-containing protein [Acidobacteriota bacterium]
MAGRRTTPAAHSQSGFTLTELTVVLGVIVTLALVLTPAIGTFVTDARLARARNDCPTIASAIILFYRDNGFFPSWSVAQNGGPGLPQNRLQILVSPGNTPQEDQPSLWTTGIAGLLSEQLVNNVPGYSLRTARSQTGWNGAYLSSEFGADPWGNRYVVNIELLDTSASATTRNGGVKAAVWVLSAGPNGVIETAFAQSILTATLGGDDLGARLQ